jgi:hypothetical protein
VSPQTHRLPPAAHAGGTSGAAPWRYTGANTGSVHQRRQARSQARHAQLIRPTVAHATGAGKYSKTIVSAARSFAWSIIVAYCGANAFDSCFIILPTPEGRLRPRGSRIPSPSASTDGAPAARPPPRRVLWSARALEVVLLDIRRRSRPPSGPGARRGSGPAAAGRRARAGPPRAAGGAYAKPAPRAPLVKGDPLSGAQGGGVGPRAP